MARIQVFQGGGIQREDPRVTPFRAPGFGPGIGPGIERLGEALGETAQKVDEIQDVHAHIEANTAAIAANNLGETIRERVHSVMGEGASAAADKGVEDLRTGFNDILSKASPRARRILAPMLAERQQSYHSEFWTYGAEQTKQAFDTSSQAANDKDLESALHSGNDQTAKGYLDAIAQRNAARARFFGLGSAWETAENLKAVSSYHKGRAEELATSSASKAIEYAIANRASMSDDDFNSIVRAYREESFDERAAQFLYRPDGSQSPLTTRGPTPSAGTGPTPTGRRVDPAMVFKGLILPNEGSALVEHDSNGAPVRFGINQKANPDVDVANLTPASAEKLFVDRYWKPSGADKMAPALAVVHADTYYLNPAAATRILKESGGDVQKYIELRNNFLAQLHAEDPAKYPDYTSRNERVEQYASQVAGDGTPLSFSGKIGPDTPMKPIEDEVMARPDMPLGLKVAIIRMAREDRNIQREDKAIREDNARDALITASTKLGDNFTSIKQLPPDAVLNASPETVASLTDLARTNRYKHDDETLRPFVTSMMVTDPKRFLSQDFVTDLMRRGASPTLISEVQTEQASIAKKQMSQKPEVISDGSLWSVAKPAFEAAGIYSEGKKGQEKTNAATQQQAVVFLQQLATEWETNHPGERATPEIMRQWVGAALLKTKAGTPLFQADDADLYNSLGDNMRNTIIRELRRRGDTSQGQELVSHVAQAYRNIRANYPAAHNAIDLSRPMVGVESPINQLSDELGGQ